MTDMAGIYRRWMGGPGRWGLGRCGDLAGRRPAKSPHLPRPNRQGRRMQRRDIPVMDGISREFVGQLGVPRDTKGQRGIPRDNGGHRGTARDSEGQRGTTRDSEG